MKQDRHKTSWNSEKGCYRLVHPDTGDFIAEYYPCTNQLVVTKHRKTAFISLDNLQDILTEDE